MPTIALPPEVTPTIACPDWCTIPTEEHLADLRSWEGSVIHTSSERIVTGCRVALSRLAYPDGTPQPDEVSGPADMVPIEGQDMNVDDAEAFARAILGAVSEARS